MEIIGLTKSVLIDKSLSWLVSLNYSNSLLSSDSKIVLFLIVLVPTVVEKSLSERQLKRLRMKKRGREWSHIDPSAPCMSP